MAAHNNENDVIRASRRPDGSWRKERRVKPGYVPPDEAVLYESKGKQLAKNAAGFIPGLASDAAEKPKLSKNQKKNEKKKQKRAEKSEHIEAPVAIASMSIEEPRSSELLKPTGAISNSDSDKKLKALVKKLRQTEILEERHAKGEVLEKEQLEKIKRKQELLDEIAELE